MAVHLGLLLIFLANPFPPSPFFDNSPIGNTGVRSNASGYSGGSSSGSTGQRTGTSSTNRQGQSGAQTEVGTQTQPNQTGRNTAATAGVDEITPAELERRTVDVDRLQIATRPSTQAGDLRTPGTADTRSPTGSNSATREGQAPSDLLRSELEAFQSAYTYSEAETSEAAAETALANWVTSVKENLEITELPLLPPIEIAITYPLRICLPVAPTAAKVGVLVSPNGEIASDPVLLKSTGYAGLNQKALQVTDTAEYSAGAAYRAYRFDVPVQYNEANCTDPQQLS
ncbi:MAG: hypothetical protein HC873_17935 [Leptolyngbyaceae cyanobacterium SL_1_1]|nr:hypothetical protein [Leptolyngbyaceae cyanobacterium SL_1_1]